MLCRDANPIHHPAILPIAAASSEEGNKIDMSSYWKVLAYCEWDTVPY
jgi:hypothetical protein